MPRPMNPEKGDEVFQFILKFKAEHDGNSPSLEDIREVMGFRSISTSSYYLGELVKRGLIVCDYGKKSRMIEVVGGKWSFTAPLKRERTNLERIQQVDNLSVIRSA